MKKTIIFIIIIYAVFVGIIINTFPINISGLLLSCFSLIALRLLKREIKTNYLEKELENYFYNKAGINNVWNLDRNLSSFLKNKERMAGENTMKQNLNEKMQKRRIYKNVIK